MRFLYKNWFIHNVIAHPLMWFIYTAGLEKVAVNLHDCTLPEEEE